MHDEDRLVAAISDLTNQLARIAWAVESLHLNSDDHDAYEMVPCSKCGSQLVLQCSETCSACLESKKEKTDG